MNINPVAKHAGWEHVRLLAGPARPAPRGSAGGQYGGVPPWCHCWPRCQAVPGRLQAGRQAGPLGGPLQRQLQPLGQEVEAGQVLELRRHRGLAQKVLQGGTEGGRRG